MNKTSICSLLFALCSLGAAHAATYYNGGNQAPQFRYSATGVSPMYNNQPQMVASQQQYNRGYNNAQTQQYQNYQTGQYQQYQRAGQTQQAQQSRATGNQATAGNMSHKGFYASAGVSHESAMWQFDMKNAGSSLHYDNISWNVFDLNAGYGFDAGDFGLKLDLGLKFGSQFGDSTMVDDDISNGGFLTNFYYNAETEEIIGYIVGRALSIGKSSGGSMFGYNVGLGLTDKFQFGNMKITPSIGYRSTSYTLKTSDNNGLAVEVLEASGACIVVPGSDETQCSPVFVIDPGSGNLQLVWDGQSTTGGTVDTGNTYYYGQPGTSHKYDVEWAGPYIALDLDYMINANNAVNGRIELGLPSYTATGDQPYRPDWAHPKSVEDSAGMGSAMHLGLGANWLTAITDTVSLTVGLTYDYYSISGADAKTYLNGSYYDGLYNTLLTQYITEHPGATEAQALADTGPIGASMNGILDLEAECPGWICEEKGEISSFYKSMGIRVGIAAKF